MRDTNYIFGFVAIQDAVDPEVAAFCQVGVQIGGAFTGFVLTGVGGGEFQMFYYLDGKDLPSENEDDENQKIIEDKYPGLINQAYKVLYENIYFEDLRTPLFKKVPEASYVRKGAKITLAEKHLLVGNFDNKDRKVREKPRNLVEALNYGVLGVSCLNNLCMN
jgi:hypothetical protein